MWLSFRPLQTFSQNIQEMVKWMIVEKENLWIVMENLNLVLNGKPEMMKLRELKQQSDSRYHLHRI